MLILGAWLTVCGVMACELPSPSSPPPASVHESAGSGSRVPTNLIMVLTDTLRPDRMGIYGGPRDTSPHFDAFARDNFLFVNAHAPSPWTRPSVASVFTGLYPQTHGVQMRNDMLPEELPTLASLLRSKGIQTVAITTNPHITESWKMTRGFDEVVEVMPHRDHMKAGNGANVVFRRLRQLVPTLREPYFLYLHLIDPHYPYAPPPEDLQAIGIQSKRPDSLQRYDASIHFADRMVHEMMSFLDKHGLLERTIVANFSDHGEEFYEHGSTGHGKTLFEEVIRVPLAIGVPKKMRPQTLGMAPDDSPVTCPRIGTNVSLVDLMPTLLGMMGVEGPEHLDGRDLRRLMRCDFTATDASRALYFSVEKEKVSLGGVTVDQAKLIANRASETRQTYLLDRNPKELPTVAGEQVSVQDLNALEQFLADLLESFETSVQPGVHLELAGLDDREDKRQYRVQLKTDGKFVNVAARGLEAKDSVTVNEPANRIDLNVVLRSKWHRSPKHVWAQDRDALRFDVVPHNSEISLVVRTKGRLAKRQVLRFPRTELARWPLRTSLPALLRQGAGTLVDRRRAGVYLFARGKRAVEENSAISSDMNAALRALGYVQ